MGDVILAEGIGLADLDAASLGVIFSHLFDSRQLALCQCVCRSWLATASNERLWAARLSSDFGVERRQTSPPEAGSPSPPTFPAPPPLRHSFTRAKSAWSCWRDTFRIQGAEFEKKLAVVRRMYRAVNDWKVGLNKVGLGCVASSFADGLTPDELARVTSEVEASFDTPTSPALAPGVPPPLALQALWCFLGGQELEFDGDEELSSSLFWGALGGYSFYNNTVSMRMLPIRKAVAGTVALHQRGVIPRDMRLLAANFNMHKRLFVNCTTGMVLVSPSSSPPHYQPACTGTPTDAQLLPNDAPLVLWLENFVHNLNHGVIAAEPLFPDLELETNINTLGISLYPRYRELEVVDPAAVVEGPTCSRCVTHGVEVTCRPLYIPEMSDCNEEVDSAQLVFSYCISMRLLEGYHVTECQLVRRHWVMRNAEGEVEDTVVGEGVIGKFPVLRAGGGAFSYESCTKTSWQGGSMEGHLEFVNGRMGEGELSAARTLSHAQTMPAALGSAGETRRPAAGQTFSVAVARFTMCRPRYVY